MTPIRIAFDPSLPVVASQEFTTGGVTYKDGQPFPWRDVGLTLIELDAFWRSGLVHFLPSAAPAIVASAPAPQRKRAAR